MGAWEYGPYKSVTRAGDDTRLAAALVAVKKELVYNGYGENVVVDSPVFGDAAANRIKEFQKDKGLKVDGQVGPTTSKELFRKRTERIEDKYGFDRGTVGKFVTLESSWDPVAIGYADPDDHGMVQINLRIHTDVTVAQSFDPGFALEWAAKYVSASATRIVSEIDVIKAARASYNIGVEYAKRWMNAGFPSWGGTFNGTDIDWYKRAYEYVNLVDKQNW